MMLWMGHSLSFGNSWRIRGVKCSEDFADCGTDGFGRARGGLAQEVLELGEDLSIGFSSGESFSAGRRWYILGWQTFQPFPLRR